MWVVLPLVRRLVLLIVHAGCTEMEHDFVVSMMCMVTLVWLVQQAVGLDDGT